MMPTPDDVTDVEITATVARVKDGIATIAYTGRIAARHTHTFNKKYVDTSKATLRGLATYDVEKKEMVSLLWIWEGSSRDVRAQDSNPLAAVVEWFRAPRKVRAAER
jgi:hypothetical protein